MEDQIAISRLKQGDLNGLEALVSRYQAQAVHAAYIIVYDRLLAEDVVQTAFVKVAERIQQFDDERPFAPWFLRIVVNDALKLARKQKRNVSLEEQMDEPTAQLAKWLTDPDIWTLAIFAVLGRFSLISAYFTPLQCCPPRIYGG
jgi:RNA polymerase sigma-70 factor (ECF subfamily)